MSEDYDRKPEESVADQATAALTDAPAAPDGEVPKEQRTMGMLCHLLALCGFVIPFGNIIGPLVMWLVKKDESPFVNDQGKESINFQITVVLAFIICIPLIFVIIGIFLLPLVGIANLVFIIIATIQANDGKHYRYPVALRLIK